MEITFNIPKEKTQRVVEALNGLFPQRDNNPDPTAEPTEKVPPAQWAREVVRRIIISHVHRWEQKQAAETAAKAIAPDETLLR